MESYPGMVMPFILFPSSITNAIALMLLPAVATSSSDGDHAKVHRYFSTSNKYSLLLGAACTAFFMIFGNFLGDFCFHDQTARRILTPVLAIMPISLSVNNAYKHYQRAGQNQRYFFDHLRKPEHETFLSHCTCSAFRHYGIHLWHNTQSGIYGTALLSYRKAPARIV